jgi:hypothetical protein
VSIFFTPIPALATADLQELLDDQAVENVRLEFEREVPSKDETLKKTVIFSKHVRGLPRAFLFCVCAAETRRVCRLA